MVTHGHIIKPRLQSLMMKFYCTNITKQEHKKGKANQISPNFTSKTYYAYVLSHLPVSDSDDVNRVKLNLICTLLLLIKASCCVDHFSQKGESAL